MIVEYHRPDTLETALELLSRSDLHAVPLGGGTAINQSSAEPVAVVDLQSLELNKIRLDGKKIVLGATVTLQQLLESPDIPFTLKQVLRNENSYNLRQVATLAGSLVATNGRSPLATAMLALNAELTIEPGNEMLALGNFFPLRSERLPGVLITQINIPSNVKLAYDYIARTPADLPIICVSVAQWSSGRTRVALGGYGGAPILTMDGPEPAGAEIAARNAYQEAGDQWASAEYRSDMAGVLVKRCLAGLQAK